MSTLVHIGYMDTGETTGYYAYIGRIGSMLLVESLPVGLLARSAPAPKVPLLGAERRATVPIDYLYLMVAVGENDCWQ